MIWVRKAPRSEPQGPSGLEPRGRHLPLDVRADDPTDDPQALKQVHARPLPSVRAQSRLEITRPPFDSFLSASSDPYLANLERQKLRQIPFLAVKRLQPRGFVLRKCET